MSSPILKPDFPPLPAVFSYLQLTVPVHQFCKSAWGFPPSCDPTTQIIDGESSSGLAEIRICCQRGQQWHFKSGSHFMWHQDKLGPTVWIFSGKRTWGSWWAPSWPWTNNVPLQRMPVASWAALGRALPRSGKVTLYSALLRHTWSTWAGSGFPSLREMNMLEWAQQRAMKVIKVLKHWHTYEERLSG